MLHKAFALSEDIEIINVLYDAERDVINLIVTSDYPILPESQIRMYMHSPGAAIPEDAFDEATIRKVFAEVPLVQHSNGVKE
jgi:hypothetical protein